jgi:hypothetical protein
MTGRNARGRGAVSQGADVAGIAAAKSNHWRHDSDFTRLNAARDQLGVRKAAPSHCTGDEAIAMFRAARGDGFVAGGCGAVIELPGAALTKTR